MSQTTAQPVSAWKRILFSELMLSKSKATRIAYVGIMAALSIVANMFISFPMFDVQFSVTMFLAMLSGILIGPLYGAAATFIGDLVGYLYNSWGLMYMPWVGLSCAVMAVISGLVMNGLRFPFKGAVYVKLAIVCLLVLVVCTVGISTTGFYFYNKAAGFSAKVIDYINSQFGGHVSYWAYLCYRMFFSGQIYNSIFNYVLIFIAVPLLNASKPLKISIR